MEQILKVLETNARTSLEELAAMTGKTVQEVAAYMDECEESTSSTVIVLWWIGSAPA